MGFSFSTGYADCSHTTVFSEAGRFALRRRFSLPDRAFWLARRADIDPTHFPGHLPGIRLVQVTWEPLDFVHLDVGSREVEARGTDPTGKGVADHWNGSDELGSVLSNYRQVATSGRAVCDRQRFTTRRGDEAFDETLFLPLSDDGLTVHRVLVYSHYGYYWGDSRGDSWRDLKARAPLAGKQPTNRRRQQRS